MALEFGTYLSKHELLFKKLATFETTKAHLVKTIEIFHLSTYLGYISFLNIVSNLMNFSTKNLFAITSAFFYKGSP